MKADATGLVLPSGERIEIGSEINMKLHSGEELVGQILRVSEEEITIKVLAPQPHQERVIRLDAIKRIAPKEPCGTEVTPLQAAGGIVLYLVVSAAIMTAILFVAMLGAHNA